MIKIKTIKLIKKVKFSDGSNTRHDTLRMFIPIKRNIFLEHCTQNHDLTTITTTISSVTTSAILMEIMLKKLFTYSYIFSTGYQEVVNVNSMGNFMSKAIISQ